MYTEGPHSRRSRRYFEAAPWSGSTHGLHLTEPEDVACWPQNEIATRQPIRLYRLESIDTIGAGRLTDRALHIPLRPRGLSYSTGGRCNSPNAWSSWIEETPNHDDTELRAKRVSRRMQVVRGRYEAKPMFRSVLSTSSPYRYFSCVVFG